ncbi:MAG: hypothetical protein R1F52_01385 [Candidatus Nitrosoabyssus spongiisocia]|nr:MAG: hypothetical protein R1F52_01385 [Nitrosopumilaceae archaeon AB1(1)]
MIVSGIGISKGNKNIIALGGTLSISNIPSINEYVGLYDKSVELLNKMKEVQKLNNELIQLESYANVTTLERDKL